MRLPQPKLPTMRRATRPALFFAVAALCAVLVGLIIYRIAVGVAPQVPVLVVKHPIGPYTQVTADMLAVVTLPASAVPNGALNRAPQAVGKWTNRAFLPGDVVRAGHLSEFGGQAGALAERLANPTYGRPGARAVSLPMSLSPGVALRVQPGDRLDILAFYRDTAPDSGSAGVPQRGSPTTAASAVATLTEVVAPGALVLDVVAGTDATSGGPDVQHGEIVVAVNPGEDLRILKGLAQGRILFALVPAGANAPLPVQNSAAAGQPH